MGEMSKYEMWNVEEMQKIEKKLRKIADGGQINIDDIFECRKLIRDLHQYWPHMACVNINKQAMDNFTALLNGDKGKSWITDKKNRVLANSEDVINDLADYLNLFLGVCIGYLEKKKQQLPDDSRDERIRKVDEELGSIKLNTF